VGGKLVFCIKDICISDRYFSFKLFWHPRFW